MISIVIAFILGIFVGAYLWKPKFKESVSNWLKKKSDKNKEEQDKK